MAEWVALQPIFRVCAGETVYEGGGRLRLPWWKQESEEKQVKVAVEAVLAVSRLRRRQESSRHGGSKGGLEVGSTNREGWGQGREHWYDGTETGDSQMGG